MNNNNNIPRIICSGKNCDKAFSKEWDEYGFSYIKLGPLPIDDDDKFEKIWFALMKTRLFCSNCCQDYTDSICKNSKIEIK
jgi:hypothetical protein